MQQLLKALPGAAGTEVVPAELLSQFLVAVDNAEPAPNLRLGRVSLSSAYRSARKEGRFSNSSWRTMSDLLSKPKAAGPWLLARPTPARGGECRRNPRSSRRGRPPANGLRRRFPATDLAFGRKRRQAAVGPTEPEPTFAPAVPSESKRRDGGDDQMPAPGELHRPVAERPAERSILSIPL
jgi:hypothetical protein